MMDQLNLNGCLNVPHPKNSSYKPDEASNFGYYHEFCRLYLANVVLTSQMKQLMAERAELTLRMTKIEKKTDEIENGGASDDRKKRKRRTAGEIQRHYRCVVETCGKSYGSEGSLNQHIKLKHYEIYQTMTHLHGMEDKFPEEMSEEDEDEYVSESVVVSKRKKK